MLFLLHCAVAVGFKVIISAFRTAHFNSFEMIVRSMNEKISAKMDVSLSQEKFYLHTVTLIYSEIFIDSRKFEVYYSILNNESILV